MCIRIIDLLFSVRLFIFVAFCYNLTNMGIEMVTISISPEKKDEIIKYYSDYSRPNKGEYIEFFAQVNDLNITVFRNNDNTKHKVHFSGKGALNEAKIWDENAEATELKVRKEPQKANWIDFELQIGSDEVGTGDFFGPAIFVAALVKKEDIIYLRNLGVDDSKRLSDLEINHIAPILIKRLPYMHIAVDNQKYNDLCAKGLNANAIKAVVHNKILTNLSEKYPDVKHIYLDQFVEPKNYFHYIEGSKNVVTNIIFKTKGESYYPSIAAASIIARYSFLKKIKEIETKYGVTIPLGAGQKVDSFAYDFVLKYGIDELEKISKKHFDNYKRLLKKLN